MDGLRMKMGSDFYVADDLDNMKLSHFIVYNTEFDKYNFILT